MRRASSALTVSIVASALTLLVQDVEGSTASAGEPTVRQRFGRIVRAGERLDLDVDWPAGAMPQRLAVIIDRTDWTALFDSTPTQLSYAPATIPLPPGEHVMQVYHIVTASDWRMVAQFRFRVEGDRTARQRTTLDPILDLANEGQLAAGRRGGEPDSFRSTFQDFTGTAGLGATTGLGGVATAAEITVVGTSHRPDALRFIQEGDEAPLVDLSEYAITAARGGVAFSLGHVTFGTHPHLFEDFSSRGALASVRFGSRADAAVAALHGTTVVGWDNFLGVQRRSHRVVAATMGFELLPTRPGGLRVEGSLIDGRLAPFASVNAARIDDVERSRGFGLRLVAQDRAGRLRLDGGYARSSFANPDDPLLAQGRPLVPVAPETRDARHVDFSYAIVHDRHIGPLRTNITSTYQHERIEPLYGSVVADLQSDIARHAFAIDGNIGPATWQVSYDRARDNLDNINSIVTTFTRNTVVNAVVPLAPQAAREAGTFAVPTLTYQLMRIDQAVAAIPPDAGFVTTAQVPDQVATDQTVALEWRLGRYVAAYRINITNQNNRQPARDASDLESRVHALSLQASPASTVDVQVDVAFEKAVSGLLPESEVTKRIGLIASWQTTRQSIVSALVSAVVLRDGARVRRDDDVNLNLEFSHTVPLGAQVAARRQVQFFARYVRQSASRLHRIMGIESRQRTWTFNTGFGVNVF